MPMGGYSGKSAGKKTYKHKGGKPKAPQAEQQRSNLGHHYRPMSTSGGKHGRSYSNFGSK